jgi:hypothetical protein
MSDETILDLFDDVCGILGSLQSQLSCITTSDTGSDPTEYIEDGINNLRARLCNLTEFSGRADERTSDPNPQPGLHST